MIRFKTARLAFGCWLVLVVTCPGHAVWQQQQQPECIVASHGLCTFQGALVARATDWAASGSHSPAARAGPTQSTKLKTAAIRCPWGALDEGRGLPIGARSAARRIAGFGPDGIDSSSLSRLHVELRRTAEDDRHHHDLGTCCL